MANQTESKTELILSAAREILIGDNAATGNTVESIESYCANRIQREDLQISIDVPKIDLSCDGGASEVSIPTKEYFLVIKPRTAMDSPDTPMTTLDRISSRINFLFNNKPSSLNGANIVVGKNLRCRLITEESALRVPDYIERTYTKVIRYKVRCDDEIITT